MIAEAEILFQAITFRFVEEMLKVSHLLPPGAHAFELGEERLYIRVESGWRELPVRNSILA